MNLPASEFQKTIAKEATLKGVGLHTGRKCQATFKPASPNFGVKFVRTDLPGSPVIPASVWNVVDVIRGTTIAAGDARVYTIEHILSALNGLGLDNLIVELDENEPPVADGSAQEIVEVLLKAGFSEQNEPKNIFKVSSPVEYVSNQTLLRIEPGNEFEIFCEINYNHPLLKKQEFHFHSGVNYAEEIAPAKTYCFDYEIEALKKKGLAKGGSLDNAIVVGPTGIYNPESFLKFPNEFVRHKLLDLMGDLMLLGKTIRGKITAKRCGHGHNTKFLRKLLESVEIHNPSLSVG